jgi:hypothetical protein
MKKSPVFQVCSSLIHPYSEALGLALSPKQEMPLSASTLLLRPVLLLEGCAYSDIHQLCKNQDPLQADPVH